MGKKKLGLVLGSGGSRGVAHIGFLQALLENGITPYCYSGCSAGAIVGAFIASGMEPDELYDEVMMLKPAEILSPIPRFTGSGIWNTKNLHKKLEKYLGRKRISQLNTKFCCIATDIVKGELKVFSENESVVSAIIASSCLPGIYEPEVIGGVAYIDGGMMSRLPINAIRIFEPEVIVAVDVFAPDNSKQEYNSIASVIARGFELMDRDSTALKTVEQKPDLLVQPELKNMSQYTFKGFDYAYYQGYSAGLNNLDKIRTLIEE